MPQNTKYGKISMAKLNIKHHIFLCFVAFILCGQLASTAFAQKKNRCLSEYTKFDICAEAKKIHSALAKITPQKMNTEMTLQHAIVLENRLVMIVVWQMDDDALTARLSAAGMDRNSLYTKFKTQTKSAVCSQKTLAAFVGLGGEVQYIYRTLDAIEIASLLVSTCE